MLANILGRLPSMGGSHFIEARRNDPTTLEALVALGVDDDDQDENRTKWTPSGVEWRQGDELLTKILDTLQVLVAITAAHPIPEGGRRPAQPRQHPRPDRPLDMYRRQRALDRQVELDDEVEQAKARYRAAKERGELPSEEPADDN